MGRWIQADRALSMGVGMGTLAGGDPCGIDVGSRCVPRGGIRGLFGPVSGVFSGVLGPAIAAPMR